MPKLIYSFLASLDGYVAGNAGRFEWAVPDEEALERSFDPDLVRAMKAASPTGCCSCATP